jgi:lipoprotein-anchoring transpeptidase ErfK/SrfK
MTSPFTFPGGSANFIKQNISATTATPIVLGQGNGQFNVVWFRCNEYSGGTPNLTVEIYDVGNAVSYYLGSGGFTWKAKALTALQSVLFDDGIVIPTGHQLRVTVSAANNVLVTGLYIGKQVAATAWTPQAQSR